MIGPGTSCSVSRYAHATLDMRTVGISSHGRTNSTQNDFVTYIFACKSHERRGPEGLSSSVQLKVTTFVILLE